ncbi:hypothetical protein ZWY2020_003434 [Hordeum vulgare]|nr:hypothetical protein ZWY2020_003434 [Hordeum vulgare]
MACSSLPPPGEQGLQTLPESRSHSCSGAVASSVQATTDHSLPKKTLGVYSANGGFPWSNAMLQPEKKYMNGSSGCSYPASASLKKCPCSAQVHESEGTWKADDALKADELTSS